MTATVIILQLNIIVFFLTLKKGFGMLLMEEAERIALEEHGSKKIAVISGNLISFILLILSPLLLSLSFSPSPSAYFCFLSFSSHCVLGNKHVLILNF